MIGAPGELGVVVIQRAPQRALRAELGAAVEAYERFQEMIGRIMSYASLVHCCATLAPSARISSATSTR